MKDARAGGRKDDCQRYAEIRFKLRSGLLLGSVGRVAVSSSRTGFRRERRARRGGALAGWSRSLRSKACPLPMSRSQEAPTLLRMKRSPGPSGRGSLQPTRTPPKSGQRPARARITDRPAMAPWKHATPSLYGRPLKSRPRKRGILTLAEQGSGGPGAVLVLRCDLKSRGSFNRGFQVVGGGCACWASSDGGTEA